MRASEYTKLFCFSRRLTIVFSFMVHIQVHTTKTTQPPLTRDAIAIWLAGVEAVRADRVVEQQTNWDGRWLTIADQVFDLKNAEQLIVVGAGKATAGMLSGLCAALQRSPKRLPRMVGWINVPQGSELPSGPLGKSVTVCLARPQGRNEPTETAVDGTREILNYVDRAGRNDCVLALISGGGSALLCSPIDGVLLAEKVELTRALSAAGANIEQLNSVRRCLSNVKGGGMARACNARNLITCIISDVLGDPLDLIASGPTILQPSPDPAQAIAVLEQLLPNQFQSIRDVLGRQLSVRSDARRALRNPNLKLATILLANNASAVDAAGQKAVELGYRYWMKSERKSEGDAILLGRHFAQQLNSTLDQTQIDCIISGGEPTVVLPPEATRGLGGRNQQLTLALLDWFEQHGGWPTNAKLAFVSGGTDGEDGPTDAAGAYVDQDVFAQMKSLQLDPGDYLSRCDAYRFFEKTAGLLQTGPTGTNVCDLRVGLVGRPVCGPATP